MMLLVLDIDDLHQFITNMKIMVDLLKLYSLQIKAMEEIDPAVKIDYFPGKGSRKKRYFC